MDEEQAEDEEDDELYAFLGELHKLACTGMQIMQTLKCKQLTPEERKPSATDLASPDHLVQYITDKVGRVVFHDMRKKTPR